MSANIEQVRELFNVAAELPVALRGDYLTRVCGDDAVLRAEVEALLACDDATGDPLAESIAATAADLQPPTPWVGKRVGSYRIVDEIGSGGMGSVYLAERADREYESRVAIKVIRGFPSADALDRLRRERQVLAGLVHPNIARLLDGGTTKEGQPFLVIEYVDGLPLAAWTTQREPSLALRLQVFLALCRAVHYAHQNLIVHRDLKPANVIVRPDDTPVLLDFGIAKLTAPDKGEPRLTDLRAFTEDYASPEQRDGRPVTTASDVYALGLILYELLCGKRYRSGGHTGSWRQSRPGRIAREQDVAWLRRDAARLDGDLDHIVHHTLADEPTQRYASAASLANDVERYLAGKPVGAGPDRVGYRVAAFVRRHRLAVSAAALFVVTLIGAALWLAVERNRAVRAEHRALTEANTANQVTDFLLNLFKAADPASTRGRDLSARDLLDNGREMLGNTLTDQPMVRARLLTALGDIYTTIGQPQRSAELLDQAVTLLRAPGADPLRLAEALDESCRAHTDATQYPIAIAACQEALAIRQARLAAGHPDIGHTYEALGVVEQGLGHYDEAGADYRRTLDIFTAAGPAFAEDVASSHHNLGFLANTRGDHETARREYQTALDTKRVLFGDAHPKTLNSLTGLAAAESFLGDFAAAKRDFEKSLELRTKVHGADSIMVARSHNELAGALQDLGDFNAAEPHYRVALDIYNRLTPDSLDIASTSNNLATLDEDRGDMSAALPLFRRSLDIRRQKLKAPHPSLARAEHNLARCLLEMGEVREAKPLIDASLALRRTQASTSNERFDSELLATEWMLADHDAATAKTALAALIVPQGDGTYRRRARFYALQARIAADAKAWPDAERSMQQSLNELRVEYAADHPLCVVADARIAAYAHAQHNDDAARSRLRTALPIIDRALSDASRDRRAAHALAAELGMDIGNTAPTPGERRVSGLR